MLKGINPLLNADVLYVLRAMGHGDDLIIGTDGNDMLAGGHGEDRVEGGAGDDFIASYADGREPVIAQNYDQGDDPSNEINDQTRTLYPDQPIEADDVMVGGEGADTFRFEVLINAKEEIILKHVNDDGTIDWQGMVGAGPYKIVKHQPGIGTTLVRHDGWHREGAFFDEVEMVGLNDPNARQTALITGDVDAITRMARMIDVSIFVANSANLAGLGDGGRCRGIRWFGHRVGWGRGGGQAQPAGAKGQVQVVGHGDDGVDDQIRLSRLVAVRVKTDDVLANSNRAVVEAFDWGHGSTWWNRVDDG